MVRTFPDIDIQVVPCGDSYTVTVARPACMGVVGNDMWVLEQPSGSNFTWLYMEKKGPLFVRKCVRDICEKVIFPAILQNEGEKRVCMISGTPGIGKSVMTNWVIAMIRSYFKNRDIYLVKAKSIFGYLIKSDGLCYQIEQKDGVYLLMDKNTIVLVDTGGKFPPDFVDHAGFAMVTASPKALPKEMKKESNYSRAFLSVWGLQDILAASSVLHPYENFGSQEQMNQSYAELWRRHEFAGGVPRILFGNSVSVLEYEDAVGPAIKKALEHFREEVSLEDNVHKVFHITAGNNLNEYKTGYVTLEIEEKFYKAVKAAEFQKVKSFMVELVHMNFKLSALQPTIGVCFEALVQGILAFSFYEKEKDIEWKNCAPKNAGCIGELEVDSGYTVFDATIIEEYKSGILYLPKSGNQPVIDSWTRRGNVLFLFQITKQKTRLLDNKVVNFFQNIMSNQKDIQIRFIYVVPTIIKEFKITNRARFNGIVSIGVLKVDVKEANLERTVLEGFTDYINLGDQTVQAQGRTLFIPRRD